MRSIKWAVAVAAVSSLMGCGNSQPSIYRVAVAPQAVPTTCYRTAPTGTPDTVTNQVDEKQWVIWEGVDDKFYLEPGSLSYAMGDAPNISMNIDGIEGGKNDDKKYVFTTTRTRVTGPTTGPSTQTTTATYTFDELGKTIKGNLALHSACSGPDCNNSPACDVTLEFSGRQIDGDRYFNYGSGSGG